MKEGPHTLKLGSSLGDCQRCGFTRRLEDMRLEWSGLRVCASNRECWDPVPDTITAPVVYAEGLPRPDAAPMAPVEFVNLAFNPGDL